MGATMGYSYLNNVELETALKIYLEAIDGIVAPPGSEAISVKNSLGRITAEAVYAKISSPHYNACAMDGIAVRARDTFGATDTTPIVLRENVDFIRVDTGDPLPDQYDAVVMIEDVVDDRDGNIKLFNAVTPWQHIRQIGEDICAGEMVLPTNTRIEPAAIGAMLAGGVIKIIVRKKLVAGLIPTGDELVCPSDSPKPGRIPEFNSAVFAAMLTKWGVIPKIYASVSDSINRIITAAKQAAAECDLVIINAGSSAGREDYTFGAISEIGKVLVHGIAIRPGKPTILGLVDCHPVVGIPGYPVSGIMVMDKIIKPVIERLIGIAFPPDAELKVNLSRRIVSSLKYLEFIRVNIGYIGGRFVATPLHRGAGVVTSLMKADGILEIPINSEGYESNTEVNIRLLRCQTDIYNTVSVIGSHDQLIDIAADLMQVRFPGRYVSSSHVGSMGGIMAIKRSEAHLAGIHLLDEETGAYNTSYIQKYLPNQRIAVVKCVKRLQGLMTAPGNPKNIQGIADICNKAIQYVNRQKGSGTRILLDYLLKQTKITATKIPGYEREEFTHLSVAALVAAGSADTGLGVFSAAKAYNLDFIPICEEEYDFIVPEPYLEMENIRCFIEIIGSPDFKATLQKMGGYRIEAAGKVMIR
jgi:putative molybdopterin biosynthesis protein